MYYFTAVETIQDITNFYYYNPDIFHTGLSWYAIYFLFQATVVLSIHHLRPPQPRDTGLVEVTRELWVSSISRSRDCLASISHHNKAAMRCLEVLNRITNRLQPDPAISATQTDCQTDPLQPQAISGNPEERSVPLTVDPTLQLFFDGLTWNNDIFEGLDGFPSTGEVESFDYLPVNNDPARPRAMLDQGLQPP